MSTLFPPNISQSHMGKILCQEARTISLEIVERTKGDLREVAQALQRKERDPLLLKARIRQRAYKEVDIAFAEFKKVFLARFSDLKGNPREEEIQDVAKSIVNYEKLKIFNGDLERSFHGAMKEVAAGASSASKQNPPNGGLPGSGMMKV